MTLFPGAIMPAKSHMSTSAHACMRAWIHLYIRTCMRGNTYMRGHAYMSMFAHAYMRPCPSVHACVHTNTHACIRACVCAHENMHACMHSCFMHMCIHAKIHSYNMFGLDVRHMCIHAKMHSYKHAFMQTCLHTCINLQVCMRTCVHLYIYTGMPAYMHDERDVMSGVMRERERERAWCNERMISLKSFFRHSHPTLSLSQDHIRLPLCQCRSPLLQIWFPLFLSHYLSRHVRFYSNLYIYIIASHSDLSLTYTCELTFIAPFSSELSENWKKCESWPKP